VCTSTLSRVASLRAFSHCVSEVYEFGCGQRLRRVHLRLKFLALYVAYGLAAV
jgi:hypothetical protein